MDIDLIDHTVILNWDLPAAAARFTALGFTLSPVSAHRVSGAPEGNVVSYTCTANQCAVFGESFIELLGVVDENAPDPWHVKEMAKASPGLAVTFGTGDAEAVDRRWQQAGLATTGVRSLERDVEIPGGTGTVRACGVYLTPGSALGIGIQAAQHFTPQYVHQPHLLHHANGATGFDSVLLAVPDDEVKTYASRYTQIFDREPVDEGSRLTWHLPREGRLEVIPVSELDLALPGETPRRPPFIAAHVLSVADLDVARNVIEGNGIATCPMPSGLFVQAADAFGTSIGFTTPQGGGNPA